MGHRDTVFPDGEATRRPFTIRDGIAYGPGVADMKAGLVMNCFVLAAFAKFGGAPAPLVGLFTGDEEIGSPEGRAVIEAEARRARVVFNSEPGRVSGNVVTGRKGGVFMGFRGHRQGGALGGEFRRRHQRHRGTGAQDAGDPCADRPRSRHHAECRAGQRRTERQHGGALGGRPDRPALRQPARQGRRHGAHRGDRRAQLRPRHKAELTVRGEFLPLVQTPAARKLFETYVAAAADTGFTTGGEFTGGCADSGFTAAVGAPTLCAVGPVGGKAHSPDEFLQVDSLVPRAQACARAILRLHQAGL